jgi:hypothetical protein
MAADRPIRLLTFGHGTATAEELAELIRHAEIQTIVDVRSVPKSRLHPWVWRQETERWIPDLTGSLYRWQRRLYGVRCVRNGFRRTLSIRGDDTIGNHVFGNRVVALPPPADFRCRRATARC